MWQLSAAPSISIALGNQTCNANCMLADGRTRRSRSHSRSLILGLWEWHLFSSIYPSLSILLVSFPRRTGHIAKDNGQSIGEDKKALSSMGTDNNKVFRFFLKLLGYLYVQSSHRKVLVRMLEHMVIFLSSSFSRGSLKRGALAELLRRRLYSRGVGSWSEVPES